jgi:hypothetical protein
MVTIESSPLASKPYSREKGRMDYLKEFEKDRGIDPEALDVECVRQAEVFFKWAERAVVSRGKVDRVKLRAEVCEATLQLSCRKNPEAFGIEGRATDASISAAVQTHKDYLEMQAKYFKARDESAMLEKVVMAMEMKKKMLENLVVLHGQQYFAGPSTPRNLGKVWMAQQQANEQNVNTRQKAFTRRRKEK